MQRQSRSPRDAFTLIEVVGAILIFSAGVLMVIQLSRTLSVQMERSAVASVITAEVQEHMDSLTALPYTSVVVGSSSVTETVRGVSYRRTTTVSQYSPLLRRIVISMQPVSGSGPSRTSTSYSSDRW